MFDLIIIGAGPAGISAAYEAKKAGITYLVLEKGLIGNTIYNYPVGLTVFSTVNELEIEPGGLKPAREKPTREELLSYYVRFVLDKELNVQTEETVTAVTRKPAGHFQVITDQGEYRARSVLFAMGAMDFPRKLGVPGEDLPLVFDHFRETYPWVKKRALIIGGGNSAGQGALFFSRYASRVTMLIRAADLLGVNRNTLRKKIRDLDIQVIRTTT